MIRIRKSRDRGYADRGWLKSRFTFSFADYRDANHMGFGPLRVINEDWISPAGGFGPHAHRDMEIMTYVLEGHLEHRDSTGRHHVVGPNEIQTMSAGSGVVHSEVNPSDVEECHLLQIWIEPAKEDLVPGYQQVAYDPQARRNRFLCLAGPESTHTRTSTVIRQDAWLFTSELDPGRRLEREWTSGRRGWVQLVRGAISIDDVRLETGDGAAVLDQQRLTISAHGPRPAELLLFDLP